MSEPAKPWTHEDLASVAGGGIDDLQRQRIGELIDALAAAEATINGSQGQPGLLELLANNEIKLATSERRLRDHQVELGTRGVLLSYAESKLAAAEKRLAETQQQLAEVVAHVMVSREPTPQDAAIGELRARLAESEAACAALREVLMKIRSPKDMAEVAGAIMAAEAALASTAGAELLAELRRLRERVAELEARK